jgi:hypothetical protein
MVCHCSNLTDSKQTSNKDVFAALLRACHKTTCTQPASQ